VPDRAQVLAYADRHGSKAAAARFGIPAATIRSWRSRARRRASREAADRERAQKREERETPSPLAQFEDRAAQLAAWAAQGACLHCGGAGVIQVPTIQRGPVVIRWGRELPCPTCGGRPVRIQVNELPRDEWVDGMARAGDMGIGWRADEWAKIRAGNPNPNGWRWTHLDRIQVGPDGPVGPGEKRPRR
jgi:transposase-like protein